MSRKLVLAMTFTLLIGMVGVDFPDKSSCVISVQQASQEISLEWNCEFEDQLTSLFNFNAGNGTAWSDNIALIDEPLEEEQFKIVNVALTVKDHDGTVMRDAPVHALSEDWGIRSPDWFGFTDAAGTYVFEIPRGNWSFFAGGGRRYTWDKPGEAYFATRRFVQVTDDLEVTIQTDDRITIDVYDINGESLDTEIRMMDSDHVPIVIAPICGKTSNGEITIHVTQGLHYDILLYTPRDVQPGYVLHEKSVHSGSSLEVKPTLSTMTHLIFEAYDTSNNPTEGLTLDINYHSFSVGTTIGLQTVRFSVDKAADTYATSELVRIQYTFYKNNWRYSFMVNDYNLTEGTQLVFQFGGPFTVNVHVLRQNTQIWLDVRDSFGNIMISFSNDKGEAPTPIKLVRDNTVIYESDISEIVGSWNALVAGKLDRTYDTADSPDFQILLDLGFFGSFNLTGTLLAEENLLHYETIETDHFIINAPEGFSDRFNVMASLFESAYEAESRALNVELTDKTEITFYINHIAAGFAYTNGIGMGIGFSLDSSYNVVPSTFIGVAFHELGHVFQLSPPLDNFYITRWFGEPFATLLGHEAIREILGWRFDLHQQGSHNRFFEYLKGKQTLDLIENIQFVLFYLRRIFGMEIHRNFVQLWANRTLDSQKSDLQNGGFNTNETLVTLYSYLAGENLAWLFEVAGVNISETRIMEGIELITHALGDINDDGVVDIFDVVILAAAFGSEPRDDNWKQAADLNNDDAVDIFDVVIIAKNFGRTVEPGETRVFVDPQVSSVAPGETFAVDIVVENVADLYGWQIWLFWNNTILTCTAEECFLPGFTWEPSNSFWLGPGVLNEYNATHGAYHRGLSKMDLTTPYAVPFDGTTVLATLTFETKAAGSCSLTLVDVVLKGEDHTTTTVYPRWSDINVDGEVNIFDVVIPANAFGSEPGDSSWVEAADLNDDGRIDITDFVIVSSDFGKKEGTALWGVTYNIYDIPATLQSGSVTA